MRLTADHAPVVPQDAYAYRCRTCGEPDEEHYGPPLWGRYVFLVVMLALTSLAAVLWVDEILDADGLWLSGCAVGLVLAPLFADVRDYFARRTIRDRVPPKGA